VVTAVTNFGLFVELKDVYVEGLVHISALESDYYHFDQAKHRLLGERSGRSYQLGDNVTVRVARVNLDDRKIDLELVASETRDDRRTRKSPAGKSGADKSAPNKSPISAVAARSAKKTPAKAAKKSPAAGAKKPAAEGDAKPARKPRRR